LENCAIEAINEQKQSYSIDVLMKDINMFKKNGHFSLDLYYNDIDGLFVCKVHRFGPFLSKIKHFREKKSILALKKAFVFVKNNLKDK